MRRYSRLPLVGVVVSILYVDALPLAHGQCPCFCPADLSANVLRDGIDIDGFVRCMLAGPSVAAGCGCADMNTDSLVDQLDVSAFANTLLAPDTCAVTTSQYEPGPADTPPASPCREGRSCSGQPDHGVAESVYLFNGECYQSVTDLSIRGRGPDFIWARKYRSRSGPNTAMGNGWDYSYNIYIESSGADRILHDGNSRADLYTLQANGKWGRDEFFRELELNGDTTYTLVFADTGKWNFRSLTNPIAPGRISSIVDRNGNALGFSYDGQGRLVSITDTQSRTITVAYNADGFISTITDFTGRQVVYAYYQNPDAGGSFGDLRSARSPIITGTPNGNDYPSGKTTTYTYSEGFADSRLNSNLLTITDPKGQTYLQNVYAPILNPADLRFDRMVQQTWGNPGEIIKVAYVAQAGCGANNFASMKTIVNDRVGNVREFFYDAMNRLVMARAYTGRALVALPTTESANRPTAKLRPSDPDYFESRWNYNADSMTTLTTSPNLNTTANTHELDLNPLAARRERGNLRQVTRNAGPLGGDQASITESFTYATGFGGCGCGTNFVASHTDGRGNTTTHTYDAAGNRIHTTHRAGGGVEDWTYNAFGQMTSHTLPANGSGHQRLDTYSYHVAGPQLGYLQSEVIDAGGFSLTTQYEYDAVGNVVRKVHPNGADSLYTYNTLDQVVQAQSREVFPGVRYESLTWYDANDNVVRSDVQNRDESGVILANTHFSTIREYETLNRRTRMCRERLDVSLTNSQLTCAAFPAGTAVTMEYQYDANRNQSLARDGEAVNGNDPFNTRTTLYDERDLLFRSIRADGSVITSTEQTDYDGNENVKAFSQGLENAPRLTTYANDGFNRRTSATDPMGNVSTFHFDANGNTTSQRIDGERLDAPGGLGNIRMSESTYIHDAMDRRTRQDIAHFDTQLPQNPIGDGFSTTQWTYANNSQSTSVTTDLPGHVTTYVYDTANRLMTTMDAKLNTRTYTYDADSNVIQTIEVEKSDLGNPDESFTTTHGYDPLDRHSQTTDNIGNAHQFLYDSRNNRVRYIDARGNHARYEYDGLNRPDRTILDMNGNLAFTDPDDIVTSQTWDDSSRLTSRTDDNGNMTAYSYDSLNRSTGTTYADCTTDSTSYDVHDNPTLAMDAVGNVVMGSYDLRDRVVSKAITPGPGVSADTTFETYAYDGRSRLALAQDNDSVVRRGTSGTSGYDSLSNVLRETQQITSPVAPARNIVAQYDGEGNQTRLTHPSPGLRSIARSYDLLDRPALVNDVTPFTVITSYKYIGPYRLEQRDYPKLIPAQTVRLTVLYDGIRRITATLHDLDPMGAPTPIDHRSYDWDANSNKLAVHRLMPPPPEQRFYTYDAANRMTQSAHFRIGNPPCITDYQFDGVGNRMQVLGCDNPGPFTMDPTLCEPGDFQMNQYTTTPLDARTYDMNGNLADRDSGATAVYTHDFRNRLIEFFDAPTGVVTTYKYDCLGRRIQKDVGGVITRFYYDGTELIEEQTGANAVAATYVYSKGPHSRLQMIRGGQKYFYHEDDQGSVMKVTDNNGNVVFGAEYLDYGALDTLASAQPPDQVQSYRSDLSNMIPGPQAIADDFTLAAPETITSLRWWGAYTPGFVAHVHDFHITIFDDNFGAPGNLVFQETAGNNVTIVTTGQFVGGEAEQRYGYTLANSFHAQAGVTYWLSIENTLAQPGVASPWRWESSSTGNLVSYWSFNQFGPWNQQPADLAFELHADLPDIGNPWLFDGIFYDRELSTYYCNGVNNETATGGSFQRAQGLTIDDLMSSGNSRSFAVNNPTSVPGEYWIEVVDQFGHPVLVLHTPGRDYGFGFGPIGLGGIFSGLGEITGDQFTWGWGVPGLGRFYIDEATAKAFLAALNKARHRVGYYNVGCYNCRDWAWDQYHYFRQWWDLYGAGLEPESCKDCCCVFIGSVMETETSYEVSVSQETVCVSPSTDCSAACAKELQNNPPKGGAMGSLGYEGKCNETATNDLLRRVNWNNAKVWNERSPWK